MTTKRVLACSLPKYLLLQLPLMVGGCVSKAPINRHELTCAAPVAALSLDETAFDQNEAGGWRSLASKEGCLEEAADLIKAYRTARGDSTALLWHEGQLRATSGQTSQAIELLRQSYHEGPDPTGWNLYVRATVAFLSNDSKDLIKARSELASLPRPPDFEPLDPQGRPIEIDWPPNLHVVDQLVRCLGRPYKVAYAGHC